MSRRLRALALLATTLAATWGACPCMLGREAAAGEVGVAAPGPDGACRCCRGHAAPDRADRDRPGDSTEPSSHPDDCPCCGERSTRLAIVDGGDLVAAMPADASAGLPPDLAPWSVLPGTVVGTETFHASPGPPGRPTGSVVLLL